MFKEADFQLVVFVEILFVTLPDVSIYTTQTHAHAHGHTTILLEKTKTNVPRRLSPVNMVL